MSVLWRGESGGRVIEVRGAGRTRRLLVDGVFHTAWNPGRVLTGAVWDHLALPGLLVRGGAPRSVLLLGMGGGAAVHVLRALVAPERIVAVELDAALVAVARRWFAVEGPDLRIVQGDAIAWSARNARSRFDLVIDDLFGEQAGEPLRERRAAGEFWHRLAGMVSGGGALVVNFLTLADLETSDLCQDLRFRRAFPAALRFSCEGYENAVAAFLREPRSAQALRARLASHPALRGAGERRLARFRVHGLWPR